MRRIDDWPTRLAQFIDSRAEVPFAWGTNDCGLFACDAVLEIAGIDMAADMRGAYDSEEGAYDQMEVLCGGDLEAYAVQIAADHELAEINPLKAQRGDVVLWRTELGPTLGIIGLDGQGLFVTPKGLLSVPLRSLDRAWRIP